MGALAAAAAAFALLAAAGCEREPVHPGIAASDLPALIPAHEFVFNTKAYSSFSISPDGSRLAWRAPVRWRSALHVRQPDGSVHRYYVGGSQMHWSADGRRLLILDDKSRAENHHLYRLDVEDPAAELVDLTPWPGVRVWLYRVLPSDPEHVYVLHNRRNAKLRDLYRIALATGAEELVAANPGDGVAPMLDASGKFLGWSRANVAPRAEPRESEARERSALSHELKEVTRGIARSADRRTAFVLSNRGRDRIALFRVDAATGKAALLYEHPRADVSRVVVSKATGQPLTATAHGEYPETRVLDAALEADLSALLAQFDGARYGFEIVSMDPAEQRLVVSVYTHGSRRYYLVDRARKTHSLLGATREREFEHALVPPEAVEFRARDGLAIPAYLVRPPGSRTQPLPLVVLVHGGPWSRVVWSDADSSADLLRAHFLANRGYAVLAVNFRGSTGYGRSYAAAAVGEVGGKMQDDLVDGARWAIEAGIADPHRIALVGHSYGGYAALMALAREPKAFACAIDIAGPTDLARLIEGFPAYWELELDTWYRFVGDPSVAADRARMDKLSPIAFAEHIERPVLIVQGENDVRVKPEQSARMAQALASLGKPVRYVLVPGMGHSLDYWAHHLLVLRASEEFLADCLGGRAARFDALEWAARLSGRLPLIR